MSHFKKKTFVTSICPIYAMYQTQWQSSTQYANKILDIYFLPRHN